MNRYLDAEAWRVVEKGFNPDNMRSSESMFSIGNGRFGQRANHEEGYSGDHMLGSYVGGVYAGRETDARSNRLLGADGQFRVGQSSRLDVHLIGTRTRPDPDAETVDNGHSVAARLASSTRRLDWNVEALDIS